MAVLQVTARFHFSSSQNVSIFPSLLKGSFTEDREFVADSSFLPGPEKHHAASFWALWFQTRNPLSFELVFLYGYFVISLWLLSRFFPGLQFPEV